MRDRVFLGSTFFAPNFEEGIAFVWGGEAQAKSGRNSAVTHPIFQELCFLQRNADARVFFTTPGPQGHDGLLGAAAAAGTGTERHDPCGDGSGSGCTGCADVWRRTRGARGGTGSAGGHAAGRGAGCLAFGCGEAQVAICSKMILWGKLTYNIGPTLTK